MNAVTIPDLEMGLTGEVHQATRAFAATLAATPQFLAFDRPTTHYAATRRRSAPEPRIRRSSRRCTCC
jgi:hypothetical protein